MKKIKILLAGYVNFPNAQNVNCDNIAKYLNKDIFDVHVLALSTKPINKQMYKNSNIHVHRIIGHKFVWYIQRYLNMYLNDYDIYYLPKMESVDINFVKKFKNKKCIISSVEGVVGKQIKIDDLKSKNYYFSCSNIFSISQCIRESVKKIWGKNTAVLYLGIDDKQKNIIKKQQIKNIVWIGSFIERKRPKFFIELAKEFTNLNFYMIGDGELFDDINNYVEKHNIKNVNFLGRIQNYEVYKNLKNMDLLVMTSETEGLPKVIGEAMSYSIPVIYINENYDVDYINNDINGYAVKNLEQMKEKIYYLVVNNEKYQSLSKNAFYTIHNYYWRNLIKDYENYFISVYKKYEKDKRI